MDKTLFDTSWDVKEDDFEVQEKELKKNEMKRDFEKQYDVTVDSIIRIERDQKNMIKDKMKNFNLDSYRKNLFTIDQNKEAQKEIKELYVKFFGEELKR